MARPGSFGTEFFQFAGLSRAGHVGCGHLDSQLASCIALLVPEYQRGRAITFVFLGWSVASVIGSPRGALIGGVWGWRWSMELIAALSLMGAA
jgi:predicted MFS family arabinose efflux permease